jgi:hypothetical protein
MDDEDDGGLGFQSDDAQDDGKDSDDDDDEDDDSDDDLLDSDEEFDDVFDLKVTMDLINSPFNKVDEYSEFKKVVHSFYQKDQSYMISLQASFDLGVKS